MNDLLTARDVSKILKVSLPLVYRMAERGQLPCIRWECPGKGQLKPRTMVRFVQADIIDFVNSNRILAGAGVGAGEKMSPPQV